MANSMHFDGVDLSGSDYGLVVADGPFPLLAPPKLDTQTIPYLDGAIYQGSYLQPMTFKIICWVEGTSKSDLELKLDNIRYLFNVSSTKSLSFDDYFSDRYWNARLSSGIEIQFINSKTAELNLEFIAPDPTAYSSTETTIDDIPI